MSQSFRLFFVGVSRFVESNLGSPPLEGFVPSNSVLHWLAAELYSIVYPAISIWEAVRGRMAENEAEWSLPLSDELPEGLSGESAGEEVREILSAGRLVQWSIELSEFDINYRPRTTIKAQALVDFIAEFTSKDNEPTEEEKDQASRWTIHTKGSSTKNVDGIGIILKSPEGDVIKQAIRLQYPTTNNEAEYEALLTGLKLAKVLGAAELDICSDSQLVVGQVNGEYEAKEECMQQYLNLVRYQMS